jgi:hypothetical protein
MSTDDMSTDETSPATGRPARTRVRRERGVAETLLSVVLVLEAAVFFFATLAIAGLSGIPTPIVIAGGSGFIVLLIVVAMVQRYRWGVVLGGVVQVVYIATGFLHPFMFVIGAVFAAMWIWCLVRARRIERLRRDAAEGVGA